MLHEPELHLFHLRWGCVAEFAGKEKGHTFLRWGPSSWPFPAQTLVQTLWSHRSCCQRQAALCQSYRWLSMTVKRTQVWQLSGSVR